MVTLSRAINLAKIGFCRGDDLDPELASQVGHRVYERLIISSKLASSRRE